MSASPAIVTGSTGIAAATVRRLADAGRPVGVVGIDGDSVAALVEDVRALGVRAHGAVADLRDGESAAAAFTACAEELGVPTAVVAVAGASVTSRRYLSTQAPRGRRGVGCSQSSYQLPSGALK